MNVNEGRDFDNSFDYYMLHHHQLILRIKKPFYMSPPTTSIEEQISGDVTASTMASIPSELKNDHDDHQCQPLPTPYCALEMDLLVRNQWIHMIVCDSDLETLRQVFHDDDISCHSIDLTVEHRRKCSSESNNENDAKLPGKVNFQDHVDTDVIIVEENGYLEGTSVSGSTSYSVRLILFDLLCLAVTFMIIMAFIAVSALPIWAIETTSTNDWNYREAFFFIVDTLTKIGYGDLVPKSMGGKIYTACCIIVGLPLVSAWVAMVGTRFLSVTSHSFNIMRNYVGHDDNGKEETGSRGDRENRSRGSANEGNDNGALEQGNDNSNNSTGNNEPNNELNTGTLVSQTQSTPPVPAQSSIKCKRRRRHWRRVHYWSKRAISSHKFRLIIQIVIIVSFLLLGAMIFSLIENWTYWNSVYFVLNTVTTIGYGDIVPRTISGKVFLEFYALFGVGLGAVLIGMGIHIYRHKIPKATLRLFLAVTRCKNVPNVLKEEVE